MGYKEVTTFAEYEQATSAPVLSFFHFSVNPIPGRSEAFENQIMPFAMNPEIEEMVDFYFIDNKRAPEVLSNVEIIANTFTHVFKDGEMLETLSDPNVQDILEILEKYNIISR